MTSGQPARDSGPSGAASSLGEEQVWGALRTLRDFAMIAFDNEARITIWNTGAENLFGWSPEEVLGKSVHLIFTPEDRAAGAPEKEFGTARKEGTAEDERWHLRKDGSRFFVSGKVTSIRDDQGKLLGFTKICFDLTETVRQRETLQQSEERYRVLVELSPQVVWFAGADGSITFCNQRWLELTGLSMEQSRGDGWAEAIPPEHRDRILHEWHEAAHGGNDFELEVPLLTREGTVRWHLARGTPVRDKHDHIDRWIGVTLDIHDRKKAEHSLQEADRNKTEFLAMLAHELRNPLAAIRNAVQVCREDPTHETCDWALAVVDRQGGQLTRLVDDLLDVSRITRGLIRLHPQRVDAAVILDHTVESVRPMIAQRHHELILSYDRSGSALPLRADPSRLEQIIGNLLTNAAKYTPDGGRIELNARVEEQTSKANAGRHILISVRDNGLGVPPEKLKEMFELFTQGARGRERSEGGLGIGLAIVKKLTEMHGGTVTAHSKGPGKGSEFTLCLPLFEGDETTANTEQSPAISQPPPFAQRVLVVDDNEDIAEGMARLLRRRGFIVELAYDGPGGLQKALAFRPNVVVLDIGLPGMDGYEVATELRREASFRAAVFIAVSGYGQEDDRRRSREAGFDHHLTKPVNFNELHQLLTSSKRVSS